MKILFSGGGTGGSVTPLLAIYEELKKGSKIQALWLGTEDGPERRLVEASSIKFSAIAAGKFRRYLSPKHFIDPFKIIVGFFQAFKKLLRFKPDALLTAGSFVSVPVVWAARILRVPIFIHQQDVRVGLANKLMARYAKCITVTFPEHLKQFKNKDAVWTGNPIRKELLEGSAQRARDVFSLKEDLPVVLVLGGGTGAVKINELVIAGIEKLLDHTQVIHLTGLGFKTDDAVEKISARRLKYPDRYHVFEFLVDEMADAFAVCDAVVARAGMGTLTELALLGKPALLIPLAGHQEENAHYFISKNAALGFGQKEITPEIFAETIIRLVKDKEQQKRLSSNIKAIMKTGAAKAIAKKIKED